MGLMVPAPCQGVATDPPAVGRMSRWGRERLGAGPRPYRRSHVRIVVALTRMPSLRDSPAILTRPPARVLPRHRTARAQQPRGRSAAGRACTLAGRSTCVAPARGASAAASGRDEKRSPPVSRNRAASRGEQNAVEHGEPRTAALRRSTRNCRSTRISRSLAPSPGRGRSSKRASARTSNESTNSISRCYGIPAHGTNLGFRGRQMPGRQTGSVARHPKL